ncbi:MAG: cyclic nucleotide-binding domain-containing protein [Balneolaceae bacterium]|nr:cyclic nucleotide-binding domain-containing protein [Balneolaceae bacterium]
MYDLILDNVSKYVELNKQELTQFTNLLQHRHITKGEFLLRRGEVARFETFVNDGVLKSSFIDKTAKEHTLHFAIEDWWITDFESLITQSPAKLEIRAIEDSQLLQLSYSSLQILFDQSPKFERFYRLMNERYFISVFNTLISLLSKRGRSPVPGFH